MYLNLCTYNQILKDFSNYNNFRIIYYIYLLFILGYPCCKTTNVVIETDGNGEWGIENDQWCGIRKVIKSYIKY